MPPRLGHGQAIAVEADDVPRRRDAPGEHGATAAGELDGNHPAGTVSQTSRRPESKRTPCGWSKPPNSSRTRPPRSVSSTLSWPVSAMARRPSPSPATLPG